MAIEKIEGYIQVSDTGSAPWVSLPTPKNGSGTFEVETIVDGGRNAQGNFIGQVVGEKCKISCSWGALSDDAFRALLSQFDTTGSGSYIKYVRFWDPRKGARVVRRMYVGDRKGTPFEVDLPSGRPLAWLDVQCNLIEV